MLNIPFLRKLAAWLHVIGWCYIIIVPPATLVFMVRGHEITQVLYRHEMFRLLPSYPFPWSDFAVAVLKAVAVGVALLVLAQFIGVGIKALEHLRNLDGEEPVPAEPVAEEAPGGIGRKIMNLPSRFPSVRLLSRVAMVLGWAVISLTILSLFVPLIPGLRVIGHIHIPADYLVSTAAVAVIKWFAGGLALLVLSQGLLWANEAVGHLQNLVEWAEEEEQPEGEQP